MIQAADDDNSRTTASGSGNLLGHKKTCESHRISAKIRKSIYAVPKHEFHQFPKLRSLLWTTPKPQVVSASTESLCGKSLSFDSIGHWTAWCCFYAQNLPCTKWTWCCFVGLFKTAFPEFRQLTVPKNYEVQLKFNHEMIISFSCDVHRVVAHHHAWSNLGPWILVVSLRKSSFFQAVIWGKPIAASTFCTGEAFDCLVRRSFTKSRKVSMLPAELHTKPADPPKPHAEVLEQREA